MSKRALKRVRRVLKLEVNRKPLPNHSEGYPLYYVTADCSVLCADCVNREIDIIAPETTCKDGYPIWPDKQWRVVGCYVHWEGEPLTCDHCNAKIESAYGPVEETV